jgi:hypothetical protein
MPANEYFTAAANAMRRAGEEKKTEQDNLRKYIQQKEVDIKNHVSKLQQERSQHEAKLSNPKDVEAMSRPQIMKMVNNLTTSISQLEADFNNERVNITQQIKNLQGEIDSINSQANQLQTRT